MFAAVKVNEVMLSKLLPRNICGFVPANPQSSVGSNCEKPFEAVMIVCSLPEAASPPVSVFEVSMK